MFPLNLMKNGTPVVKLFLTRKEFMQKKKKNVLWQQYFHWIGSIVIIVNYLLYGPYGSFGPTHDSSLSNVTQEETDLLLQSYGSELGVLYSKRYPPWDLYWTKMFSRCVQSGVDNFAFSLKMITSVCWFRKIALRINLWILPFLKGI